MNGFIRKITQFWGSLESLDERIYFMTLFVANVAGLVCSVVGIFQGLNLSVVLMTAMIFVFTMILSVISIRYPRHRQMQKVLMVLAINFLFFPSIFFPSGGIYSGVILFFLAGLFLVGITLRGSLSWILFTASLLVMQVTLFIAHKHPALVSPMTEPQHFQDVQVTLFLSGMSVYAITTLILTAYERERHHNEVLMEKLRNLSTRDALSGLYNRRELFRRLEIVYNDHPAERSEKLSRDHQYIAMFDVDNFKHLNDTYGHSFGDTVLAAVAHILDEAADPKNGEMASRYGGEEFVCLLTASGLEEAVARVDAIRQKVAKLRFEEVPGLGVTISGGVVPCNSENDLKQVMHNVDELLYEAKARGKNRICSKIAQPVLKQE